MEHVNILHLSDLQFGNQKSLLSRRLGSTWIYDRPIHDQMTNEFRTCALPRPDIVVVSGDIAERGDSAEYDSAYAFFTKLHCSLQSLPGAAPPLWVIVPGNHDVDRKASLDHAGQAVRREAMLRNFYDFLERLRNPGGLMVQSPRDTTTGQLKPFRRPEAKVSVIVVPIDSCENEGHGETQHQGSVSEHQLDLVERAIRPHFDPWAFLVAVMHHNVVLNAPRQDGLAELFFRFLDRLPEDWPVQLRQKWDAAPEALKRKSANTLAARLSNTLADPETALRRLAELGCQLVLHGHQHYDGPIHLQFPLAASDPFGHEGLTVMAAGAVGIDVGGDQPSVPSFQFYQVRRKDLGWAVESRRFVLQVSGDRSSDVQVTGKSPKEWHCYTTRQRKLLVGVRDLIHWAALPSRKRTTATKARFQTISECLAWGWLLAERDNADGILGIGCDQIVWQVAQEPQLSHEALPTDAVLSVLGATLDGNIYSDLAHWSLIGLLPPDAGSGSFTLKVAKSKYLPYVVVNTNLSKDAAFRPLFEQVTERLRGSKTCEDVNTFLNWAAHTISTRLTFQVIVEVHRPGSGQRVLLRRRSDAVSHMPRQLQFTVGGGFKCALGKDESETPPAIGNAIAEEVRLETNFNFEPRAFRLVWLALSSEEFSPTITAVVVEDDEQLLKLRCQQKKVEPKVIGGDVVLDRVLIPDPAPRDWWEGSYLVEVDLGGSLVATERHEAIKAWQSLANIWVESERTIPGSVDIPPGAAIAAVLAPLRGAKQSPAGARAGRTSESTRRAGKTRARDARR